MLQPPVYLFVYGTLQPGFVNPFAQLLHKNSRHVGPGTLRGRLYDIGHYPGAIYDINSHTQVHGSIFDVTQRPDLLSHLDEYEGVSHPPTDADEYVRAMVPVCFDTNELHCWTYLYNWPTPNGQQIKTGRYDVK